METLEMLKVSIVLPAPNLRFITSGTPLMEIKDRILQAAQELFFKYGIRSISMDDIAKHRSISKKTIYQAFRDKDEVVHMLMQKKLKEDESEIRQMAGSAAN